MLFAEDEGKPDLTLGLAWGRKVNSCRLSHEFCQTDFEPQPSSFSS